VSYERKQQQDFEFLLHEYDAAHAEIRLVGERRYNIFKFYSTLIIAIISAISTTYIFKEIPELSRDLLCIGAFAIGVLIAFLVFKEHLNITKNLNKINFIRDKMQLDFLDGVEDKQKEAIHMNTRSVSWLEGFYGKISFWLVIAILVISFCFIYQVKMIQQIDFSSLVRSINFNLFGLFFSFLGASILFVFNNPYRGNASCFTAEETIEKDKKEKNRLNGWQKKGFALIAIGFLLQIIHVFIG